MNPDAATTDAAGDRRGRWKRWLRWAGGLLFILALAYLGQQILHYREELGSTLARPSVALGTAGGALAYALMLVLLGKAWTAIAAQGLPPHERRAFTGADALPGADALHAYSLSGVYKYLPGNFLHFVSRQALFRDAGAGQWQLAKASLAEVLLQAASAACIGGLALSGTCAMVSCGPFEWFGLRLAPGLLGLGLLAAALLAMLGAASQVPIRNLLGPALLNLVFFIGFALILIGLFMLLGVEQLAIIARLVSAYLIAWLIGFVTPGAPGGLGVREAAFLVLAGTAGPIALEGALLGRLVSTAGDLLFPLLTGAFRQAMGTGR
jgi:hypothetical protein